MDVLIVSVKWQKAIVYIDDVMIFLTTPEEHLEQSDKVLLLPKKAEVTIKLKNDSFIK